MICTTEEIPGMLAHSSHHTVGLTSGCYDLLHYYHLHYLQRARAACDFLIVGVDADSLIQINKGKSPVIPEYHRTAMVAALRCVDVAFTMRSVADITFLCGYVNRLFRNAATVYGQQIVPVGNVDLVIIPDVEEVQSTTKIIEKIRAGGNQDEKPKYT